MQVQLSYFTIDAIDAARLCSMAESKRTTGATNTNSMLINISYCLNKTPRYTTNNINFDCVEQETSRKVCMCALAQSFQFLLIRTWQRAEVTSQ